MSVNRITTVIVGLLVLAASLAGCTAATPESAKPETQPAVEQDQPQSQPEPQPAPDPQPEAEVKQEQQQVQDQTAALEEEAIEDDESGTFLGLSSSDVDAFSGERTTVIAAQGDGAFPYDGFLAFGCWDGELYIVLADIPYVTDDTRNGDLLWVSPSRVGEPAIVGGVFFDSVGGDRNWRRHFDWEWLHTTFRDPLSSRGQVRDFVTTLMEEGRVTVRLQTYDEVFSATFDFGDITAAEHWPDLADCESS